MTRDEAIFKAIKMNLRNSTSTEENLVDTLIAFGVLTVDTPKSVEDEAVDALRVFTGGDGLTTSQGFTTLRSLIARLNNAGFNIVRA